MNGRYAIEVRDLVKTYDGSAVPAVNNISFNTNKGEIFGLLGPNGAGKTTTISILCGLKKQTSGQVLICGLDHRQSGEKIKRITGIVPQDIALFPTLTAYENLRYFGNMFGMKGSLLRDKILQLLDEFGLVHVAHKQIGTYSGGMKRRINLIAGILHDPELIFLDEPTVGVDVQSRNMIVDFLRKLNAKGTTILYTSHLMEEAQSLCTSISIMDHGLVIASGAPGEMISSYGCQNLEEVFLKLTGRSVRD
jgi:ABC-2 type transport system ATP-binding protein